MFQHININFSFRPVAHISTPVLATVTTSIPSIESILSLLTSLLKLLDQFTLFTNSNGIFFSLSYNIDSSERYMISIFKISLQWHHFQASCLCVFILRAKDKKKCHFYIHKQRQICKARKKKITSIL